ncbi:MAG: thioredoxin family protein [Saprospiraceae bacterium]|jgi:protein disulfide-isomerase|nr:thioredoxin family protein [Saprospiraceae bacterium]
MSIKLSSKVLATFCIYISVFLSNQINAQTDQNSANNLSNPVAETYTAENPGWLVSVDEAYTISKKTGKPIMANFTGSDWCGWCKRLTASVFSQDAFKEWAEKNVVLLELDFPRRKVIPQNIQAQNASLQQAFQVGGYPTVWVFNLLKDEKLNQYSIEALGKTGYTSSVEEFTAGVEQMIKK